MLKAHISLAVTHGWLLVIMAGMICLGASLAILSDQQDAATGEISHNVGSAAEGTKVIASVLSDVAGVANEARTSAQTLLEAAEAVASVAANLRDEVESFLGKVAV
jgi:methyl-accepting chemotaxis protein